MTTKPRVTRYRLRAGAPLAPPALEAARSVADADTEADASAAEGESGQRQAGTAVAM